MRTRFFILFILLTSQISFAQINKGAILLDGSGSFNISRSASDQVSFNNKSEFKNVSFNLGSQIAFFTSETLSLGAGLTYNYSNNVTENNANKNKSTHNFIRLTTTATKYVNLVDKLYFTGALTVFGGIGVTRNEPGKYNTYQIGTNAAPGLAYFISDRWMITTTIGILHAGYSWRKIDEFEDDTYSDFNAGLSFDLNNFSVGFRYLLRNGGE